MTASPEASATDLPVISKYSTLASNETWTAGNVYMVSGNVAVPSGVTLTIEDGAIVKFTNYYQSRISVDSGGVLDVAGTPNDPAIFTSYRDDSVGGDSNGDGLSAGAPNDYGLAIEATGGDVSITSSIMRYGEAAFSAYGAACDGPEDITLTDNVFKNPVVFNFCKQNSVTLLRNHFEVPSSVYPLSANGS